MSGRVYVLSGSISHKSFSDGFKYIHQGHSFQSLSTDRLRHQAPDKLLDLLDAFGIKTIRLQTGNILYYKLRSLKTPGNVLIPSQRSLQNREIKALLQDRLMPFFKDSDLKAIVSLEDEAVYIYLSDDSAIGASSVSRTFAKFYLTGR